MRGRFMLPSLFFDYALLDVSRYCSWPVLSARSSLVLYHAMYKIWAHELVAIIVYLHDLNALRAPWNFYFAQDCTYTTRSNYLNGQK